MRVRGEDKTLTGRVPFQCQQNPDGVSSPNTCIPPNQGLLPHITTYIFPIHTSTPTHSWIHWPLASYKSLCHIFHVCDKVVTMKAHLGLTHNSANIVKDLPAPSGPFPVQQDTKIPLFRLWIRAQGSPHCFTYTTISTVLVSVRCVYQILCAVSYML